MPASPECTQELQNVRVSQSPPHLGLPLEPLQKFNFISFTNIGNCLEKTHSDEILVLVSPPRSWPFECNSTKRWVYSFENVSEVAGNVNWNRGIKCDEGTDVIDE